MYVRMKMSQVGLEPTSSRSRGPGFEPYPESFSFSQVISTDLQSPTSSQVYQKFL